MAENYKNLNYILRKEISMSKLIRYIILFCILSCLAACSHIPDDTLSEDYNRISVSVPGLKRTYRLVYISDLHIINDITDVDEEHRGTVRQRKESMINKDGQTAMEYWPNLVEQINSCHPDMVLLGGDMIDYMSSSNVACLNNGLRQIKAPVMYVRADHDYAKWYDRELTSETIDTLSQSIDSNNEIMIQTLDEITILGINNNTSQISADALETLNTFFADNTKPVILLTHVPFSSEQDPKLREESKEVWQNRDLTWGKDCYYVPNQNTSLAINAITAPENHVAAVLSGHLHFFHTGKLTDNITQYIFPPAYNSGFTVITLSDGHTDDKASVPHFLKYNNV